MMSPVFLLLAAVLGVVFVYAMRRTMRTPTFKGPTPEDAAEDVQQAAAAREVDADMSTASAPPAPRPSPLPEALGADWGRVPAPASRPSLAQRAYTPPPQRQALAAPSRQVRTSRARALLGSRDGLHRAVVAMTVLGPCRALDPYMPERSVSRR